MVAGGQCIDVGSRCKIAIRSDIQDQGWSLYPCRYSGSVAVDEADAEYVSDLQRLHGEFHNSATTLTLFAPRSTWRSTGFLDDDCQVWWSRFLPHGDG